MFVREMHDGILICCVIKIVPLGHIVMFAKFKGARRLQFFKSGVTKAGRVSKNKLWKVRKCNFKYMNYKYKQ